MHGEIRLASSGGSPAGSYAARVMRAFDRRRLAAAALVTLLLSFGPMFSSGLFDFFSPGEVALAWLEHLCELAVIAAALIAVYTLLDEALPPRMRLRLAILCIALLCWSVALALLLYAYYAHGFAHLPPPLRLLADSFRWGLPAVFLAIIADVHQRAMQTDAAAHAAESTRARSQQGEDEQQLALLQAQIEPHFLFNVLGNVRRLYRTRPGAGAAAVASLMRYLRITLPQVRNQRGTLAEEIELVRSYLDLFQVRMGARLTFSIEADPALQEAEFPPMLLMTLVENAVKHGLEPAGGGHVLIRAERRQDALEVAVLDDGAGFGTAPSGGTGVGLANVRRQLAARYQNDARLTLESRVPRGAFAVISVPWRPSRKSDGAKPDAPFVDAAPSGSEVRTPLRPLHHGAALAQFTRWLRTHRGAVAMAGVLSLAAPVTFFTGSLSVMREPTTADWAMLTFWWLLFAVESWCLLLVVGYAALRLLPAAGRFPGGATWLLCAFLVAACVSLSTTEGRAGILIEQGVVQSAQTLRLYSFTFVVTMAMLYFAHLQRSRRHEEAVARLADAQTAQREAGRRMVQSRLQAVQARTDPQLLFEMLDAVRQSYEVDPPRAERLLDELISFLRSALPRLRAESSSVPREVGLARHYVQLRSMASEALAMEAPGGGGSAGLTSDISADALHARFPPGVLLPLLDDVLRAFPGACRLAAARSADDCRLVLTLPARPSNATVSRVRALLADVYGKAASMAVDDNGVGITATVTLPYELA